MSALFTPDAGRIDPSLSIGLCRCFDYEYVFVQIAKEENPALDLDPYD